MLFLATWRLAGRLDKASLTAVQTACPEPKTMYGLLRFSYFKPVPFSVSVYLNEIFFFFKIYSPFSFPLKQKDLMNNTLVLSTSSPLRGEKKKKER